ncbi:MAG: ribose-5-phosphate isomerase RpiA [Candidatus Hydrogenedentota bacterium]
MTTQAHQIPNLDKLKQYAASRAVELVESGMVIGLGHGSTAIHAVRGIAQKVREGSLRDIRGIPCSRHIEGEAESLGLSLVTFDDVENIDLTIDGADEVDTQLNCIKGGGGALLREKVVAQATAYEVIIVDDTKLSSQLGKRWPIPVEVVPFALRPVSAFITELGGRAQLRETKAGLPLQTDQGNYILDCHFGPIANPEELGLQLGEKAGVVEHGLFLNLTSEVIVASAEGVRVLKRT